MTPLTRRVLVVDDQPSMRMLLSEVLQELSCGVETAADGAEGAEIFERDPTYDLVITDLLMPRLSGWELVRRLRAVNPTVPIIVLAGSLGSPDLQRAQHAGVAVLHKPVQLADLQAAIARALGPGRGA